jgi:hypothetical protein
MLRGIVLGIIALLCATPAFGENFQPTIYSDGASCPGNCDAHVVFHRSHNGTKFASLPSSPRSSPVACKVGEPCRICFDDRDSSCMDVLYRGNGPDKERFDFTPTFYETTCPIAGIPEALAKQCKSFDRQFTKLTADAVYCLSDEAHPGCKELLAAADAAKAADQPLWEECLEIGEAAFNRKHAADPAKQRSEHCAYEKKGTGGPNSKGQTWRRLLPAACQKNAYVGRDGLDCCDSNNMSLGGLGRECTNYTVKK